MNQQIETADIVLAATLKCLGYDLREIVVNKNSNKGTFVFEDVDSTVLTEFDMGKLAVEPITFNNIIRQLTTSVRRRIDL